MESPEVLTVVEDEYAEINKSPTPSSGNTPLKGEDDEVEQLKTRLEDITNKHLTTFKKLNEAEEKLTKYETVTREAYEEVGHMQTQLQEEQRCLETAVRVASRLYSKNTELRKQTIRRKSQMLSSRRQNWLDKQNETAKEELTGPIEPLQEEGERSKVNDDLPEVQDKPDQEEDESELSELADLDEITKSDLENAQEEINTLKEKNDELTTKLNELQSKQKQNDVAQLKAVIAMQDSELSELRKKYDVESHVRQRAETYAAKLYGKNKAFQRNSVLLNSSRKKDVFEHKLQESMKQMEKLCKELEEEKMENRHKVQKLEEELTAALNVNVEELENKINLLNIQLEQLKTEKQELQNKNSAMELELKTLRRESMPLPQTPIPPPPPPPPPLATMPNKSDPIKSLYEIIAERKAARAGQSVDESKEKRIRKISSTLPAGANMGYTDAMEEMMKRIKSGNALKKTGQQKMKYENMGEESEYCSIEDRTERVEESKSSDEESDDDGHIYSFVGGGNKRIVTTPNEYSIPGVRTTSKAATIGGFASPKGSLHPPTKKTEDGNELNKLIAGLKPVKAKLPSDPDETILNTITEEKAANKSMKPGIMPKMGLSRDNVFQDSVKLPKNMNPDLRRILDKRRRGMKKTKSTNATES